MGRKKNLHYNVNTYIEDPSYSASQNIQEDRKNNLTSKQGMSLAPKRFRRFLLNYRKISYNEKKQ